MCSSSWLFSPKGCHPGALVVPVPRHPNQDPLEPKECLAIYALADTPQCSATQRHEGSSLMIWTKYPNPNPDCCRVIFLTPSHSNDGESGVRHLDNNVIRSPATQPRQPTGRRNYVALSSCNGIQLSRCSYSIHSSTET